MPQISRVIHTFLQKFWKEEKLNDQQFLEEQLISFTFPWPAQSPFPQYFFFEEEIKVFALLVFIPHKLVPRHV